MDRTTAQRHPARWEFLNVSHIVERGGIDPAAPAVVFEGEVRTYGDLRKRSRQVANALVSAGLGVDDRLAISARNCIEYFEVEFGTTLASGIFVPMSWRLSTDERVRLLQRSKARALVTDSDFAVPLAAARDAGQLPELKLIVTLDDSDVGDASYEAWLTQSSEDKPDREEPPMTATHEIIYTSGTTGEPKGVIWSQGTVLWNSTQQIVDFDIRPGDSTYVALDLNYIGGRHDFTLAMLQQGGSVHVRRSGGFDAAEILRYLAEHEITHVLWVPTMLHDVLQNRELIEGLDLSQLRLVMCGGSPLSEEMTVEAQNAFPHGDFVQVFGLTEGGGTPTFVPKHRLRDKIGSAGLPSMFNEIMIVTAEGLACAPDEVGEILVRGPAVTPGYWENETATASLVSPDGWLHTGDLGRLDNEGFLYVAGRARDMIITGGMNVFPADVEHVIAELPGVDMVSVVGLPDPRWGERVCAVVRRSRDSDITADQIIAHCRLRMAGYKKPTQVVFLEEFPLTISGKIRKNVIKDQIMGGDVPIVSS